MTASNTCSGRQTALPFLLFISLFFSLSACTDASEPPADAIATPAPDAAEAAPGLSPERMAQWTRNCALCHVRGEGGAPTLGDREAWQTRWAQGEDALLEHTVEGLNNMPPLGYCMDCEESDFLALIRFMGGER